MLVVTHLSSLLQHDMSLARLDEKFFTVPSAIALSPFLVTTKHIPDAVTVILLSNRNFVSSIDFRLVNKFRSDTTIPSTLIEYDFVAAAALFLSKKLHCCCLPQHQFLLRDKYCFPSLLHCCGQCLGFLYSLDVGC